MPSRFAGKINAEEVPKPDDGPQKVVDETVAGEDAKASESSVLVPSPPPGLPGPVPIDGMPSVGSAKHATKECRPCAWYWKPNSCSNGKDCLHCHLCPEDEIKRRKKAKLGKEGSSSKDAAGGSEEASDEDSSGRHLKGNRSKSSVPPPLTAIQEAQGPPSTQEGPDTSNNEGNDSAGADVPSSGSVLHAQGKCKPCAWFWKPGGCTNGKECCHCHLCDKDELKGRRRAKESAMMAGGLLPASASLPSKKFQKSPKNARTMNILNIFPLL